MVKVNWLWYGYTFKFFAFLRKAIFCLPSQFLLNQYWASSTVHLVIMEIKLEKEYYCTHFAMIYPVVFPAVFLFFSILSSKFCYCLKAYRSLHDLLFKASKIPEILTINLHILRMAFSIHTTISFETTTWPRVWIWFSKCRFKCRFKCQV